MLHQMHARMSILIRPHSISMLPLLSFLCVATSAGQIARPTLFSDRPAFTAASSNLIGVGFEGLAPRGGAAFFDTASGLTQAGVTFVGMSPTNRTIPYYLRVVDPAYAPALYDWGSGAVLHGPPLVVMPGGEGGPDSRVRVNLPAGTTAVGSDIMSFLPYASLFDVTVVTESTTFVYTVASFDHPRRAFVGFTSAAPMTALEFATRTGYPVLDNFAAGVSAPGAPTPSLGSLTVSSPSIIGGTSVTGTVTLTGPAAAGGAVVNLQSNNVAARVPASVTVLAGQNAASFAVTTSLVTAPQIATITANYASVSRTAILTVNPPGGSTTTLTGVMVSSPATIGGSAVNATLTLSDAAPVSVTVDLRSDTPAAQVPPQVTIAAGLTSINFSIRTPTVTARQVATITASYSGVSRASRLTVNPYDGSEADALTRLIEDPGDRTAIGNRTPVILIHGIHGNRLPDGTDDVFRPNLPYWEKLVSHLERDPIRESFRARYKLYRFHYVSDKHRAWELARALRNDLDAFRMADPDFDKPLVIIAHSMGGLVARYYMNKHSNNVGNREGNRGGETISRLITLATPHHGSPGANHQSRNRLAFNADRRDLSYQDSWGFLNDWSSVVSGVSAFLWTRFWERITYREANRSDLLWDNFDGIMESEDVNRELAELNRLETYDSKTTAYYGYLVPERPDYQSLVGAVYLYSPGAGPRLLVVRAATTDDKHQQLLSASVVVNHGLYKDFRPYARNDGFVPVQSAAFDGHTVGRQVECPDHDHLHMVDGHTATCNTGLTLFESLAGELGLNLPPPGRLTAAGATNAASFQSGPIAPGEILTIFGSGIGPPALVGPRVTGGRLDNTLVDTRVLFDGVPAPLIYVQANQISAIVPYTVAGKPSTRVHVEYRTVQSNAVEVPVAASAPGIFTLDSTGRGPGAILNEDGSINSASNPATKGSIVVLFATGEGQTDPDGADGEIAGDVLPKPRLPVRVRIGGLEAEILYAGAAPGLVAGVLQVNARVPTSVTVGGSVPVVLTVGNASSQPGVTVALSEPIEIQSFSMSPSAVTAGGTATGTVRLSIAAPPEGAVVSLLSSNLSAVVPESVTVPPGQSSANFTIRTTSVSTSQTATLTASYAGSSRQATLTINPAVADAVTLESFTITPSIVTAGASATGSVRLSGAAPAGGIRVDLQTDNSAARLPCPFFSGPNAGCVILAAGQASATFTIQTTSVSTGQTANITASYAGVSRTATLAINPSTPQSPWLNRSFTIDGAVTLEGRSTRIRITMGPLLDGYIAQLDNGLEVASPVILVILFDGPARISGNTLTLDQVNRVASNYVNLDRSANLETITSATLTLTLESATVGAPVRGSLRFSTSARGPVDSAFSGTVMATQRI